MLSSKLAAPQPHSVGNNSSFWLLEILLDDSLQRQPKSAVQVIHSTGTRSLKGRFHLLIGSAILVLKQYLFLFFIYLLQQV